MNLGAKPTPREFGEAAKAVRLTAGVALEAIAERTKIAVRVLTALESGDFTKLPSRTFARMFVRQYFDFIGEPAEPWMLAFDGAWARFVEDSQTFVLAEPEPARRRRTGPWLVGAALLTAVVVVLLLAEQGQRGKRAGSQPPTPAALLPLLAPTPLVAATPETEPTATPLPSTTLAIRTHAGSCWVEVRVGDDPPQSRLMLPESVWTLDAGGREVSLLLGDAGSVGVEYLGEVHDPVGKPGVVARLRLAATAERRDGTG